MTNKIAFFKKACFGGLFFFSALSLSAQDDLLAELEGEQEETIDYTIATFKGTKIFNLQSNEIPGKGVLQYMILHRFGSFQDDFFYNFLGLNNAEVRLQLDYSFTDWLNVGVAQASAFPRSFDGFVKYKILRQKSGAQNFPFSLTGYNNLNYRFERWPEDGLPRNESDRLSYTHSLILARKFSPDFSLELVPTVVHFNIVDSADDSNDLFALGVGGRYKLTQSLALSVEYIHQFNPYQRMNTETNQMEDFKNVLSIGVDIETGGHVFQLFFTNSRGVADPYVIAQTPGSWADGDIHFGFNISRVFTIVRPKELRGNDSE